MGWFEEQLRNRNRSDDTMFSDSVRKLYSAIMGGHAPVAPQDKAQNAVEEILHYYHARSREVPNNVTDPNERLEYLLRPCGIMRRPVHLEAGWYKDAAGAMLGSFLTGEPVALLPAGFMGYRYTDPKTGAHERVNKKNAALFEKKAFSFYAPLPLKKIGIPSLLRYIAGTLSGWDLAFFVAATLAVTLVGLLNPKLNNLLISRVLPSGSVRLLGALAVFMVGVTVSSLFLTTIKNLLMTRINTKMSLSVEAASMMRVLSMPPSFFKKYSSGELANRSQNLPVLCNALVSALLSTGLTSVFSLVYITQIFSYAPGLVAPALGITLITVLFSTVSTLVQTKLSKRLMENSAKLDGLGYALISGVQKIKLSGSEKRAFSRWASLYAQGVSLEFSPPLFLKLNGVISTGISLGGMILIYYMALRTGVSVADYYAFNVSYSMVTGAFASLAGTALSVAQIRPIFDMVSPLLEAVPEQAENKQMVTHLSGSIELSHVSFRYTETMPWVLNDLTLKIKPGEYVALVGETGCGKSTLMRLLLNFETPAKGAVYYDGRDLSSLDPKSLRRKIGVVTQDGKLFEGEIFSNITLSAPWLTRDEAWQAAELAGIAEDIRNMPMGMNTLISGGSGSISGGQRQRLMIARAIAAKPRILMFDEATSALDNLTQKKISDSLDNLKCTRLVIAHRLSTIRRCDRILVLANGHILEEGNYGQLIAKNGYFAELVARQRLEQHSNAAQTQPAAKPDADALPAL